MFDNVGRAPGAAMKFQCERCKTRYSIADEKVRGKILKIRCKTCASIVTVRDPTVATGQAPALSATGSFGAVASPTGSLQFVPRAAPPPPPMPTEDEAEPPSDDWFISIDGRQEGPFTLEQAQARVAKRRGDEEMFAWREDFSEWQPVEEIPLLARHLPKAKPPAPTSMFGDAPEDAEPPPRASDPHDGMDFNIADASRVVRMPLLAPTVAGRRDGGLFGRGSVAIFTFFAFSAATAGAGEPEAADRRAVPRDAGAGAPASQHRRVGGCAAAQASPPGLLPRHLRWDAAGGRRAGGRDHPDRPQGG